MTKVLFDARWLRTDGVFDGVSRYSQGLGSELARQRGLEAWWLVSDKAQLDLLPEKNFILANSPDKIHEEYRLPKKLNAYNFDVVYSPFFIMGFRARNYKLVLTIHDLIYFTHRTPPHWLPPHVRAAWRLFHLSKLPIRKLLNQADIVATVSDTARQEILDAKITKRPIFSVKNAVNHQEFKFGNFNDERHKSPDVLYMGAFTQYKNVELLIDALRELPHEKLHLLSKIPARRRKDLEKRIKAADLESRVVIHNGVSDEVYRQMLASCRCLITASKLEGFGLPIIEAQALGVPVACAQTPIFQEIAGESAVMFDAENSSDCARAIKSLAESKINRHYSRAGRDNAAKFSWQASAEQAAKICQQLK